MQKHVVVTFIAIALAIPAVAWVQPATAGGTAFLVVIMLLSLNAMVAFISLFRRQSSLPPGRKTRQRAASPE